MTRHICLTAIYILEFGDSTLIFIGAHAIFQISSLKIVFSGPILYLYVVCWSVTNTAL